MIGTICLTRKPVDSLKSIEVAGWGTLRTNGRKPDFLQTVVVPVKPNRKCYEHDRLFYSVASFCAGVPGQDSCVADSGGPAMQHGESQTLQVGIVSYGYVCGRDHGYYTRLSSYINWIKHFVG
ncbi:trypsin-1-like [Ixodes scapularis]